jgi:hypothetical protein
MQRKVGDPGSLHVQIVPWARPCGLTSQPHSPKRKKPLKVVEQILRIFWSHINRNVCAGSVLLPGKCIKDRSSELTIP